MELCPIFIASISFVMNDIIESLDLYNIVLTGHEFLIINLMAQIYAIQSDDLGLYYVLFSLFMDYV
jgi:hypothetical protein